jgi:hypothetical protein
MRMLCKMNEGFCNKLRVDGGRNKFVRNIGSHLPDYTVAFLRFQSLCTEMSLVVQYVIRSLQLRAAVQEPPRKDE